MKKTSLAITCIALALAYQFFLYWPSLSAFLGTPESYWQGEPLLTTPDGYLFLRFASEYLAGTFSITDVLRPYASTTSLPLLSALAASISSWTGSNLNTVAFYLPPALASLMIIICIAIGRAFGSIYIGLLTFCFSAASPMWFHRTIPGNFDTDGLNQVLFWGALFLGYQMTRGKFRQRCVFLACWLLTNSLLYLWWPQAAIPFIGLNVVFIAIGLAFEHKWLSYRLSWLIGGVLVALATITYVDPSIFPAPLTATIVSLKQHLYLITGDQDLFFLASGKSIGELGSLSFSKTIEETAGHLLLFIIAAIGAVQATRKSIAGPYFILPGLFFFAISFVGGNRFLMFCAPTIGIGVAWFLTKTLPEIAHPSTYSKVLISVLGCILIVYASLPAVRYEISLRNDNYTVGLLQAYKQRTTEDAKTWNWWGPGYFIQYFSQRQTFIDGGSQSSERAYLAAVPYASSSPELSKNWIKFFTAYPDGLAWISRVFKNKSKALEFLLSALRQPYRLDDFIEEYDAPRDTDWKTYLFPDTTAYICVLNNMLYHGSWLPIGLWTPTKPTQYETTTFAYQSATIDRDTGTIDLPNKTRVEYSKLYFITPKVLSHDPIRPQGPAAILMQGVPYVFLLPQKYFDVLTFKLLFISPDKTPGFTPIAYHPYVGGIWKVE